MKKLNSLMLLLAFAGSTLAQTTWSVDKVHSKIGFSVMHMAITEVEGFFRDFEGSVVSKAEDFSGAEVTFTAKSASINTENEKRDAHLKSADFFEVEKYPEITFKGNIVKSGNGYKLKGNFTMHGVTKPVEFDVSYAGQVNTGRGVKAGFKVFGKINRQDYKVAYTGKLPGGELSVADEVEISCKIELDKKVEG